MSTENVRDNLVAHLAIAHLLNQYTNCLNTGDWDVLRTLFTHDSTWRVITKGQVEYEFNGGENIAIGLREAVTAGSAVMAQMNHAPVIDVDGECATASSTIEELYWSTNGLRIHRFALYADELQRGEDDEWRFRLREFRSKGKLTFGDQLQA